LSLADEKPMPFKLDNGSSYFEGVEFLRALTARPHQNYLATCPKHVTMFKHANGSRESMMQKLVALTRNRLQLVLAQEEASVYFSDTHISDLKAVIQNERDQCNRSANDFRQDFVVVL
jgi:hypothetical protein